MKKIILLSVLLTFLVSGSFKSFAQTVETGHEVLRGEMNFLELADYYAHHPEPFIFHELENEDDEHPDHPPITDPALIRYRTLGMMPPVPLAVMSPAPTDTFEATLDGGGTIPPDTQGAVDSNYCLTATNQSVHIQTRAGANVSSVSLNAFFSSVISGGTFDPRVHYDPYTSRWILVAVGGAQSSSSCILIAISKTSNPTGAWWTYKVTAYPPGDFWLDYPNVGFNNKWITVTGNLFPNSGPGYNGCKVFVFNKANLLSGAGAPFTAFTQATSECITPAITYDPALPNMFCLENYNGLAGGGGQLTLWKITGAVGSETMSLVNHPASAGFRWQGQGAGGSDFAPQLGTASLIQTNDDRLTQVVQMNNKLWTAHNVFLPSSGTVTRCSVQWWQIDTFGTPVQIGYVDDPTNTNFYAFPTITANINDDALVGFTNFSSGLHPSAAYAMRLHTDAIDMLDSVYIFRHGQNTYFKNFGGSRDRWGDYSGTCLDPLNQTDFWTVQEASAPAVNTWDTWWAYIKPCNPPTATITAGGPLSFCAGGSVVLNATTGTGYSYQWQLGGVDISGGTSTSYTASAGGNYTLVVTAGSCNATSAVTAVTVNPLPAAITGTLTVCPGSTTNLGDVTLGGTWISTAPGIATVGTSGIVTGVAIGTTTIKYTLPTTCFVSVIVTVFPAPTATITPAGPTVFCSGGSVVLNANTGVGLTYQWQLGGIDIGGATDASYTASAAGSYRVIVTNASLCSATSAATVITVNPGPPAITGTAVVCVGATTPLFDASPGGTWTSGNLAVATIGSSSGVVTGMGTGGLATITYTATTGCTTTIVVTVNSATAGPITGPSAVCIGQTITLADITPGGTWTSGTPGVATVNSFGVVTGVSGGTTIITYSVTSTCGSATATKSVAVSAGIAVAPIAGTFNVCSGGSVTLTDPTPAGVWSSTNTGIATVGSSSGVVTGVFPGIDTIVYSVTNLSGCVSTAIAPFTVFSTFAAVITPAGPTTFCTGASVVLNATTGTGYTYQWKKNGINIAGATTSAYTASTTGLYTVVISSPGGCNATSAAVSVTVSLISVVTPEVSISASPGFILCLAPAPVTFTGVPVNGGSLPTYQWFVNGSPTGIGNTYSYTPAAGDIVTVTMTSSAACAFPLTASHSDTIVISPLRTPSVSVIANKNFNICDGESDTLKAVPVYGGTDPTYVWTKNGINVATGPQFGFTFSDGDVLYCTMTSNYPCLTTNTAVSVNYTMHVTPSVPNSVAIFVTQSSIVSGSIDTFVAVATNGGTSPAFQWLINGVPVPGATSAMYITSTLMSGQVASCMETSNANCANPRTAVSGGIAVNVMTDNVKLVTNNGSDFKLLPNPNKGAFTISGTLKNNGEDATIIVTDMLGQTIYKGTVQARKGNFNERITLDNSVASGNYFVSITSGDDHAVFHVVVNK
jgi:Secretion system C-terminal sorting domain